MKSVKSYQCDRHQLNFLTEDSIKQHYLDEHRRVPNKFFTKPIDMKIFQRRVWNSIWNKRETLEDMGTFSLYHCKDHKIFTFYRSKMDKHIAEHENHPKEMVIPIPGNQLFYFVRTMRHIYAKKTSIELM